MNINIVLGIVFFIYCIVFYIIFKSSLSNKYIVVGLSTIILSIIFILYGENMAKNVGYGILTIGIIILLYSFYLEYDRYSKNKSNLEFEKSVKETRLKILANTILYAEKGNEQSFTQSCLDLAKETLDQPTYDQLLEMKSRQSVQEFNNMCGTVARIYLAKTV